MNLDLRKIITSMAVSGREDWLTPLRDELSKDFKIQAELVFTRADEDSYIHLGGRAIMSDELSCDICGADISYKFAMDLNEELEASNNNPPRVDIIQVLRDFLVSEWLLQRKICAENTCQNIPGLRFVDHITITQKNVKSL
jgi:hypothetical protein